ncbi:stringent starvation protein B [Alicycliphilus sp. B1]|nr:stringent starvation protein B [Alicycliphilus sp. B1]
MVRVNDSVQVPRDYVNNGEIVLNVSYEATSGLQLGNDFIEFKARFGGKPCDLLIPVHRVIAIYARENGQAWRSPGRGGGREGGRCAASARGVSWPPRPQALSAHRCNCSPSMVRQARARTRTRRTHRRRHQGRPPAIAQAHQVETESRRKRKFAPFGAARMRPSPV